MRIAVAGGTGVVGRHVVRLLRAAGHEPVVLSRTVGTDLLTGSGLAAALVGVDAVVDVSGPQTVRRSAAVAWFERTTGQLLEQGRRAGVRHHVVLSIVGIDRVRSGYYAGKLRQEALALAGPLPVSVLRATQFHEFAGQVLHRTRVGLVAAVPRLRVQPVAAAEVAERLAALAAGPAVGRVPDLSGPRVEDLVDMARRLVRTSGARTRVLPLPPLGVPDGGLLPAEDAVHGHIDYSAWLTGRGAGHPGEDHPIG